MALLNGKLDYLSSALSSERMGDLRNLSADEIASRIERLFPRQQDGGEEQDDRM
jgi:hypothetical protein